MKGMHRQVSGANDILGPAVHSPGDVIGSYMETPTLLESVVKAMASKTLFSPATDKNWSTHSEVTVV